MSMAIASLAVHAVVRHQVELPPLQQALRQLSAMASQALGHEWGVAFSYGPPGLPPPPGTGLVLLSLLHEALPPHAPLPEVAARWHQVVAELAGLGVPLLLCNLFRHVPPQPFGAEGPARAVMQDRIRRLNLLAVELSHRHAVDLADVDRSLAYLGALPMQTDFLLARGLGTAVAADVITGAILQGEVATLLPDAVAQALPAQHRGHAGVMQRFRPLVRPAPAPGGG